MCVSDRKRSGVSGSIRSVKMYRYAQCIMQEKSVCCRDVPCLAHMEQGPGPLHLEYLPPSLSAWVLETQSTVLVALIKDEPWQWSGHLQAAQPRICGTRKMYVNIVLYFQSSNTVFWNAYQMIIKWLSAWYLFLLYFKAWLTTTWNKQIPYVRSSHFPGCLAQCVQYMFQMQPQAFFELGKGLVDTVRILQCFIFLKEIHYVDASTGSFMIEECSRIIL